jgi:hypothetical protein
MVKQRGRALLVCSVAAATWLGCNALLGIDDGTLVGGNDDGAVESSVLDASDASDGTADATTPLLSTKRNELRIPRGHTTTVEITIDRRGITGDLLPEIVALPMGIENLGVAATANGMAATLRALPNADVAAPVMLAATIGGRRGVLSVPTRVRAPGTVDDSFSSSATAGSQITNQFGASVLTVSGREVIVAVGKFSAPFGVVVARVLENGSLDQRFGTKGTTELPVPIGSVNCFPDAVAAEAGGAILLVASCTGGTLVARISADGKSSSTVGYPFGPAGERFAGYGNGPPSAFIASNVLANGSTSLRDLDGGVVGTIADFTTTRVVPADAGSFLLGTRGNENVVARLAGFAQETQYGDSGLALIPEVQPGDSFRGSATTQNAIAIRLDREDAGATQRLVKLAPNGTLDISFGDGGVVTGQTGRGVGDAKFDALDRLVVATAPPSSSSLEGTKVRRYGNDGTTDPAFGDGGAYEAPGFCIPQTLARDADGMLLLLCDAFGATVFRIWP